MMQEDGGFLPGFIIATLLLATAHSTFGQACSGGNKTTFLRSEGYELQTGQRRDLYQTSLMECSQKCTDKLDDTGQYFNCNSFEYDENTRSCVLVDQSAQPFGTATLVPASGPNKSFFQKICVASVHLCDAPFSFERVPMHVLVGFALEVVNAPTLSECLRSCLESVQTFLIECKSAMYYHDTKECILNREDRRNRPDLFTSDTQGYIVDYFDNNCAGTQCFAPEVKQYVKVEDNQLTNRKDVELFNIDLPTCQHFCDYNQNGRGDLFPCKAFMYREDSKSCYLSGEQSLPRGRMDLSYEFGTDYYEKICLTSQKTCGSAPSFERVPQHVLVGFAKEVKDAPSLGECLNYCLSSLSLYGYECQSLMYFYETAECLLNTESRSTKPELFTPENNDARVDYFDNICLKNPGLCPTNWERIFVRVDNGELPGYDTSGAIQNLKPQECARRCEQEKDFVCRSFDYNSQGCTWSYQDSSLLGISRDPPQPTYYMEARCVKDGGACGNRFYAFEYKPGYEFTGFSRSTISGVSPSDCLSMCLINTGGERCLSVNYERLTSTCHLNSESCRTQGSGPLVPKSSYDYYENQCISSPVDCAYEAVEFDRRQRELYQLRTLSNVDQNSCKRECDREEEFICRSLSHSDSSRTCYLSDQNRAKPPEAATLLESAPGFTYLEKSTCSKTMMNIDCRYDGTRVQLFFPETSTGSIFVKNRFSTCRVEFQSTTTATLTIPFPGSRPQQGYGSGGALSDCDGVQVSPGVYSYTVVSQTNPYHVPGLVTSEDHIFNVTCDYSNSYNNNITISTNNYVTGDPIVTNVYGSGKYHMDHLRMVILRNDAPVEKVLLGEELDLKWQLIGDQRQVGYFIRDCYAERLGGNPPAPDPVTLIRDGCPVIGQRSLITTEIQELEDGFKAKMVMFRFDGSKSVKLRCSVDMCADGCQPTTCQVNSAWTESFGKRKKRQSWAFNPSVKNVEVSHRQLGSSKNDVHSSNFVRDDEEEKVVKEGEISGVFTIVDRLHDGRNDYHVRDDGTGHHIVHWKDEELQKEASGIKDSYSREERGPVIYQNGSICLIRPLFFALFVFLSLLSFAEATVIFAYCWNRACGDAIPTTLVHTRRTRPRGGETETDENWETATGYPSSHNGTTITRERFSRSQVRKTVDHRAAKGRSTGTEERKWKRGKSLPLKNRRMSRISDEEFAEEDGNSTTDSHRQLMKKNNTKSTRQPRGKSVPSAKIIRVHAVETSSDGSSPEEGDRIPPRVKDGVSRAHGPKTTQPIRADVHGDHRNSQPHRYPPPQYSAVKRLPEHSCKTMPKDESSSEETLDGIKHQESDVSQDAAGEGKPRRRATHETESKHRGYRSHDFRNQGHMGTMAEEIQRQILL